LRCPSNTMFLCPTQPVCQNESDPSSRLATMHARYQRITHPPNQPNNQL
jgi:hypothetical protein